MNYAPSEQAAAERWMRYNNVRYVFTDEARWEVIQSAKLTPWSSEECLSRCRKLKENAIKQNSYQGIVEFFERLREYERQEGHLEYATIALREENAHRIYRIWFTHFDSWYDRFYEQLTTHPPRRKEISRDEYAF